MNYIHLKKDRKFNIILNLICIIAVADAIVTCSKY